MGSDPYGHRGLTPSVQPPYLTHLYFLTIIVVERGADMAEMGMIVSRPL